MHLFTSVKIFGPLISEGYCMWKHMLQAALSQLEGCVPYKLPAGRALKMLVYSFTTLDRLSKKTSFDRPMLHSVCRLHKLYVYSFLHAFMVVQWPR